MTQTHGPRTPAGDAIHAMKYRSPGEDFREAMNRVAFGLKDSDAHYHQFREVLLDMRFLPAGRIQSAVGAVRQTTPYNCFVSGTIADSYVEGEGSIMQRTHEAAATMRQGGGIGYDFSTLRPRGAPIKRLQSQATGPVSFMGIFNQVCLCTSSSGHRRGAQMGMLSVGHPDIEEFVRAKQNETELTGFNVSVAVTDDFMEALAAGRDFDLTWGGERWNTVDAGALWEMIMRSAWDWAEPGIFFVDRVNAMNNLWYCEDIRATNPCVTGDTLIAVAGRGPVPIADLAAEGRDVPVFAVDPGTGETVVRTGRNPRLTGRKQRIVRVTLDDGSHVRCTENHKFPLRDGRKVEARDLKPGDSLFRFDATTSAQGDVLVGKNRPRPEQHLIAEAKYGRRFNWGRRRGQYHCHHVDRNHQNNAWDNIEVKFAEEHARDHLLKDGNPMDFWWTSLSDSEKDDYRTRMSASTSGPRNGMWGRTHSPETRSLIGQSTDARFQTPESRITHGERTAAGMTEEVRRRIRDSRQKMFITVEKTCLECEQPFSFRAAPDNGKKIGRRRFCSIRCSLVHRNRQGAGKPLSEERRAQISAQQRGRSHSAEHNQGVAEALRGKPKTEAHRAAMSEAAKRRTDLTRNDQGQYINHKVVSVESDGYEDVYNITVDEFHNYAVLTSAGEKGKKSLVSGIYVANCGEQPLPPHGACLLGSFNLPRYLVPLPAPRESTQPAWSMDLDRLRADLPVVVRAMDNVVDRARYPLPMQKAEALSKRRMGLGVTGLANAGEACGHPYGSPGFLRFTEAVLTVLRDEAYRASVQLAAEKGAFPLFDQERYPRGRFIQTLPDDIRDGIARHGIRNSHLTSIAPTGTISSAADNVSSGLEPVFAYETRRPVNTPDGQVEMVVRDHGVQFLGVRGVPSHEVTARQHVDVLTCAQGLVDSAISKTCNVAPDMPWEEFKGLYRAAYDGGAKGCTVFNTGGKRGALLRAAESEGAAPAVAEGGSCEIDPVTGRRDCGG